MNNQFPYAMSRSLTLAVGATHTPIKIIYIYKIAACMFIFLERPR